MEPKTEEEKEFVRKEWLTRHLYNPLPITSGESPEWIQPKENKKGCDCT